LHQNELCKFYNGILLLRPVTSLKRHLKCRNETGHNLNFKNHCKIYKVRFVTINMEFYKVMPEIIEFMKMFKNRDGADTFNRG
jgi:hypothetical protein